MNCPYVSAPSGCLNYEAKSFNKDDCPTSYECLDDPAEENPIKSSSGESSEIDDVIAIFTKYQDKILPKGAEVIQFEIVKEQDLLIAIYLLEDKKFRSLFTYEPSANEFNFIRKAHFEEGGERDWKILEGENIRIKFDKTIIKPGSTSSGNQVISKDMHLYENPHKDFSMQYPKNWYYRSFGAIEDTIWAVGFAEEFLDHFSDAIISIVILEGKGAGKKEMKGDRYTVEINRDKDSHFFLDGPLGMKEAIDEMSESIIQN